MEHIEIEVRFLGINKDELIEKLNALGAEDLGEDMLEEQIIYDKDLKFIEERRMIRIRTRKGKAFLTYKNQSIQTVDGTEEVEFGISDAAAAKVLFEKIGFVSYREQQKLRHTYKLDTVIIDIDTWPHVPPYVELEGESEEDLKKVAEKLELAWSSVELRSPRTVLEEVYNIPISKMRWFTFDRFE